MRIVLVTGANKGIGFAIAKGLAEKGCKVILTARDEVKGSQATSKLKAKGSDAVFCPLDVTNGKSAAKAAAFVEKKFGKLDVLVNNAGILLDEVLTIESIPMDTAYKTMETNFFGALRVCKAFLPLLKKSDDARIINISSGLGQLSGAGAGYPAYSMSKVALNGLTVKLAAEEPDIKVNSVSPGWVRTDMGGRKAPRTPEEGADTAVWLATAPKIPSGKFFQDRREIEW
jgi:NAD(P)-dependent dehydrogenase (short-subunit alcohol dehydrogenase family)